MGIWIQQHVFCHSNINVPVVEDLLEAYWGTEYNEINTFKSFIGFQNFVCLGHTPFSGFWYKILFLVVSWAKQC